MQLAFEHGSPAAPVRSGRQRIQPKLRIGPVDDPLEREADRVADAVVDGKPAGTISSAPGSSMQRMCAECEAEEELQRKSTSAPSPSGGRQGAADHAARAVASGGRPLTPGQRAYYEPRFGRNLSDVRLHADGAAAEAARSIDARSYTIGNHIAFATGQYAPASAEGNRLLAHELSHVVQQGAAPRANGLIQRAPASHVSCSGAVPLVLPDGTQIADPVGEITAAETLALEWLDLAIGELTTSRDAIRGGADIAWPTVADATAEAIRVMGIDPENRRNWTATGVGTVHLLIRRLQFIRDIIGGGSLRYTCLGPDNGRIGPCSGPICSIGNAASCPGTFRIVLCDGYWTANGNTRARIEMHEAGHIFADFMGHEGRDGNVFCYNRVPMIIAGVPVADQRVAFSPDP